MKSLHDHGIEGVIDSHTHSGGTDCYNQFNNALPHTQGLADLLFKAAVVGIDKVVTMPFPNSSYYNPRVRVREGRKELSGWQDFPYQIENRSLLYECKTVRERVLPFLCVDPTTKVEEQLEVLRQQYDEHEFSGLKLHTLATGSNANELADAGFVDFALERNSPILIHSDLRAKYLLPMQIIQLARKFPALKICIAHLAWLDDEALDIIPDLRNLFVDCSPYLYICNCAVNNLKKIKVSRSLDPKKPAASLVKFFQRLPEQLIWGTDEPWTRSVHSDGTIFSDSSYFEEVNVLIEMHYLNAEAVRAITHQNTCRYLFGL